MKKSPAPSANSELPTSLLFALARGASALSTELGVLRRWLAESTRGDSRQVAAMKKAARALAEGIAQRSDSLQEMALFLVARGADASSTLIPSQKSEDTPLALAARLGNAEALSALLPVSDPQAHAPGAMTALMLAATKGNVACVKALLAGCDPNARAVNELTALMLAAFHGQTEALALLLPVSDARLKNEAGCTALMLACLSGHAECARMLLPVSEPLARSNAGKTALDLASKERNWESADCFARFAPLEALRELAALAPPSEIPATLAAIERAELAQAMGEAKIKNSEGPSADASESAPARAQKTARRV